MKTAPQPMALLGHALAAWSLSVGTVNLALAVLPMRTALIIHAATAPLFFGALAWAFHRSPGRSGPLPTALFFLLLALVLDVMIQLPPRLPGNVWGHAVPLALGFGAAWGAGVVRRPEEAFLVDSVHIEVPPAQVFDWFRALPEHYPQWHPDHRSARWEEGQGLEPGAVLRAEELLHGSPHVVRSRLVSIEPGRGVDFVNLWPMSVLSPSGSFHMEPEGAGCRFTHILKVRWPGLWTRLTPQRADSLAIHMREEGANLKRLLEGAGLQPAAT